MAEVIHDSFDGEPPEVVKLEDLPLDRLRRLAAAGSREAARELVRRRRRG